MDNSKRPTEIFNENAEKLAYKLKEGGSDVVNFAVDPTSWRVKTEERSRGRMKITIKLNREETISWRNFIDMIKPDELSEGEFTKAMFLTGVQKTNEELSARAKEYFEQNKEELAASGVEVNTEGEVPVIKSYGSLEKETEDGSEAAP